MSKILIIEDEEILLNVLKSKLEKEGYDVVAAVDGEEGLKMIDETKPDMVLLDIVMPKMNGFEVLDALKSKGTIPALPVIIISNSGQPVEVDRALEYGIKDYLVKAEFDPQEVVDKIKKHLNQTFDIPGVSVDVKQSQSDKAAPLKDINTKQYKVLVVEDDQFLRDLMSHKISKEGFEIIEAVDGEEGLKITLDKLPHIVLLDLILPGMDGFEVLQRIRQDSKAGKIPVVILSNLGQKDDVEKGLKLGATDYLVKAHNTPGEIVEKVKAIIAKTYL